MLVFRLALRALAWRAGVSATVFAVALVGIIAAAIGPIYLHAVDETVLAERLTEAPQAQRDIHISRATLIGTPQVNWLGKVRDVAGVARDKRWFDAPVFSEEAQVVYEGITRYATQLAAIDDVCAHVKVVAGRCLADDSTSGVLVTARTAREQHLEVGDVIKTTPAASVISLRLQLVGIITPRAEHGRFWGPWNYFNATPSVFDNQLARLDSFFVSHLMLAQHLDDVAQTVAADLYLRPDDVHVDDVAALRSHLHRVEAAAAVVVGDSALSETQVGSQLPSVLDGMNKEMSLARTLIILPSAQLVLLAMFVLYAVVARTTAVLGPEVALAKLRGRRPVSVLLQSVVQPIVLIVLAAPLGALLAWLVVRVVADRLLGRHVDTVFPLSALGVVAAATGAAALAALIAARRIVVAPVGALLRRGSDRSGSSLGLALADAAAVTLALAGLVELVAGGVLDGGQTDPLSALAPTLLAVAVAIAAVRLLPLAGQTVVRWTRDSRRLAAFLAVRQVVRRPESSRVLVPVGIALALATFAVTNWSVAGTNRELRALNQAGARTVLDVAPSPDVYDLREAVNRADPSGASMAAASVQGGRSTPLLAVDTRRFPDVATWRANYADEPLRTVLSRITRGIAPSISFAGSRLRLDLDVTEAPPGPLELTVYVTGANHLRTAYSLGPAKSGRGGYVAELAPICAVGCRVTGLHLAPPQPDATSAPLPSDAPQQIRATVSATVLRAGRWLPVAGLVDPRRWRDDGEARAEIGGGSNLQLTLAQVSVGGAWPELLSADSPSHLPAVLASGTAEVYPGPAAHDASSFGLDDRSQPIDGVLDAITLPQLDRFGVLVDYGVALNAMIDHPGGQTHFQVWLGPSAPSDMRARLARQGVTVTGVQHASRYRAALDRTGPAFADALFLVAAGAAALLAVGAAVLAGVTTSRRRAYEIAALQAAGVPPRALRRSLALEQGLLLGAGIVVGIAAGLGGSALALPSTPFFVDETIGPPTEHGLPWGLLATLAAAVVVVFALTSVLIARLVARQATVARFREAQQ